MKTINEFRRTEKFCITNSISDLVKIAEHFGADNIIAFANDGDSGLTYTIRAFTKDRCELRDYLVKVLGDVQIVETVLVNTLASRQKI